MVSGSWMSSYGWIVRTWDGHMGCRMCSFWINRNVPTFPGSDEVDQINRIHKILGTPSRDILAKLRSKSHSNRISLEWRVARPLILEGCWKWVGVDICAKKFGFVRKRLRWLQNHLGGHYRRSPSFDVGSPWWPRPAETTHGKLQQQVSQFWVVISIIFHAVTKSNEYCTEYHLKYHIWTWKNIRCQWIH